LLTGPARTTPRYTRLSTLLSALIALNALSACGGGTSSEPSHVRVVVVHETDSVSEGSTTAYVRHVYTRLGTAGKLTELYSVSRDATTGAIEQETYWSSAHPNQFTNRDWVLCHQQVTRPPRPFLHNETQLLADMIGPRKVPKDATWLGPHEWQVHDGIGYLRIKQPASGTYLSRVAYAGIGAHPPADVLHIVSDRSADALPHLAAGWASCQAHPRLPVVPAPTPAGLRSSTAAS
jgi:hypothetical protein